MQFLRYLFLLTLISMAVDAMPQAFHGGVTAGVVGSQVAGDNFSGYNKGGIYGGGWVSLDLSERTGIKTELTYFQKGSRENPNEKNGYHEYLLRLNYIELPVLFQYKIKQFTIEAGPSAGFLMGYYEEVDQDVISDYSGYNKPSDVTFQINLGLEFSLTPVTGVGIRTNNSLWNVFSENETGDVWRFWDYGRFNDAIIIYAYFQFR